jgi:hypothetical protein
VKYGDFLGLVLQDKQGNIREIGLLSKVTSIVKEIYSYNNSYYPLTYVRLEAISRMKISDFKRTLENVRDHSLFKGTVEILEDEISNKNIITSN